MLIHRAPIVALVLSCAFAAPDLAAQVSGSVYTTDRQGDVENVFRNPGEVYLAGGPGPNAGCSGNGLVDGDYYFQVTDPSGSVLLSNDTLAERLVTVSGGVISGSGPGGHGTRNGPCGSKIVKLAPFDPSPSSSGEYKVWFTNILDYVPNTGFHGFIASDSKTDNFKIRGGKLVEQTIIGGTVFFDFDENGLYDPNVPGEVVIPGWKVEITSAGVTTTTFTDADGRYQFIRDRDGSLHDLASLAPDPGYVGETGGRWAPTTAVEVTVVADVPEITVDFGKLFMINTPEFSRSKGYWHNQGELELLACDPVWRTVLNDQCLRTNFSNPNGQAGTLFTVSEGTPFSQSFQELSDYLVGNPALGSAGLQPVGAGGCGAPQPHLRPSPGGNLHRPLRRRCPRDLRRDGGRDAHRVVRPPLGGHRARRGSGLARGDRGLPRRVERHEQQREQRLHELTGPAGLPDSVLSRGPNRGTTGQLQRRVVPRWVA